MWLRDIESFLFIVRDVLNDIGCYIIIVLKYCGGVCL